MHRGLPRRRDHLRGPGAGRVAAVHRDQRRLLPPVGRHEHPAAEPPGRRRWRRLLTASVGASLSFLAASVGVAPWEVAGRVPDGWWLVSALGLVGGVAQLLVQRRPRRSGARSTRCACGPRALGARRPARRVRWSAAEDALVRDGDGPLGPTMDQAGGRRAAPARRRPRPRWPGCSAAAITPSLPACACWGCTPRASTPLTTRRRAPDVSHRVSVRPSSALSRRGVTRACWRWHAASTFRRR